MSRKKQDVNLEHIKAEVASPPGPARESSRDAAVSPGFFSKKKNAKHETTFVHRTSGFTVKVISADALAAADLNGRSDPYCKLRLGNNPKQKTRIVERSLNPVWNESFYFPTWAEGEQLKITVWDYDRQIAGLFGKNDFLGSVTINRPTNADGVLKATFPLVADEKHKARVDIGGTIELEIIDYATNKAFIEGERKAAGLPAQAPPVAFDSQGTARNLYSSGDEKINLSDISVLPMTRGQSSVQDQSPNFTYDICMVFNIGDKNKIIRKNPRQDEQEFFAQKAADVLRKMHQAGLKTHLYKSSDGDEIYCLIGASEERLRIEADRTDFELELDHKMCIKEGVDKKMRLAMVTMSDDPKHASFNEDAWKHIYGPYQAPDATFPKRELLYRHYDDEGPRHVNSIFRTVDRLKLTVSIIEAEEIVGGAGIRIENSCDSSNHPMASFFALHQESRVQALENEWTKWHSLTHQPLNEIRNYYGEQVAMYFSFMEYYSRWLIFPSIVGFAAFVWQLAAEHVDVEFMPYYVVFVAIWATSFLEAWKRRQSTLAAQWGTSNLHLREQPRSDFQGSWEPSLVHGRLEEQFPLRIKLFRTLAANGIIATLITIVIASFVSVYILRKVLKSNLGSNAAVVAAFINAAQIQILNQIYGYVARRLNDWENYKTDTDYENALIAKTFLFKFINSYNTLFYIAFFKKYDDGCYKTVGPKDVQEPNCLEELRLQLAVVFASQLIVNNIMGFVRPRIDAWRKNRHENKTLSAEQIANKTDAENQFVKNDYDSTFDDMDEVSVQFGYVSLFVVAFPIAPLLALLNNAIMVRLDAIKLLRSVKRPEPRSAKNIGTWQSVYNILGFIAVITNVALLCFASDSLHPYVNEDNVAVKFWVFIILEHLLFLLKFAIAYFVPDETHDTSVHLQRQEYIVEKLIEGVAEDADVVPLAADPLANATLLTEAEKEERIFSLYDVEKIQKGYQVDEHHLDPHHAQVAKQGLQHISVR